VHHYMDPAELHRGFDHFCYALGTADVGNHGHCNPTRCPNFLDYSLGGPSVTALIARQSATEVIDDYRGPPSGEVQRDSSPQPTTSP